MVRVGGTTSKYYKEKRGIKVSGGARVKSGTVLTRQGHRWKPGLNVSGMTHLTASCDGEVYFTKRKSRYNKMQTVINVRPAVKKKTKKTKEASK